MSRRIVISETSKVAGELADVDRLLLGDPLEDPVAPVDGGMGRVGQPTARARSARHSIRHPVSPRLTTRIDEPCSIVFDYRCGGPSLSSAAAADGSRRRRVPWPRRRALDPGAVSCSSARARAWSGRPRRSTRRSSTRSSRRRSARRSPGACSASLTRVPGRGPRHGDGHLAVVLNIPVLIMMALLASSMPRTGGDYVWVSRILSPPLALISNFGAALSATIGATFWARYFPVFALGPILVTLGVFFDNQTLIDWGNNFQKDSAWIFVGGDGDGRAHGRDPDRRPADDVPLAERVLDHRLGRDVPRVHRPGCSARQCRLPDTTSTRSTPSTAAGRPTTVIIGRRRRPASSPNAGEHERHPADRVRHHDLHDVELVVGLPVRRAQERLQPRPPAVGHVRRADLGRRRSSPSAAALLFKVTGYDFMVAVNTAGNTAYAIPTAPWYHFLASLVYNIPILTFLIVGSFLFWSLPAMVGNTFMPIRSLFAWSFDRLLPEKRLRRQRADPLAGHRDRDRDGDHHADARSGASPAPTSSPG